MRTAFKRLKRPYLPPHSTDIELFVRFFQKKAKKLSRIKFYTTFAAPNGARSSVG